MTLFILIIRVLLAYWILSTVVKFIGNMRKSGGQDQHVRGPGAGTNRSAEPDIPTGDIEDADFEEIDDK